MPRGSTEHRRVRRAGRDAGIGCRLRSRGGCLGARRQPPVRGPRSRKVMAADAGDADEQQADEGQQRRQDGRVARWPGAGRQGLLRRAGMGGDRRARPAAGGSLPAVVGRGQLRRVGARASRWTAGRATGHAGLPRPVITTGLAAWAAARRPPSVPAAATSRTSSWSVSRPAKMRLVRRATTSIS